MIKSTKEEILTQYRIRVTEFTADLNENKVQSTKYSYIRLAIFLLGIPLIYFLTLLGAIAVIVGVILLIVLFIQAVLRQQKYDKLVKKAEYLILINENEIQNIQNFSNKYYDGDKYKQGHHIYSDDLDIFGANSLFSYTNRARTYDGCNNLRELYLIKPSRDLVISRQEAIKELEPQINWRQEFASSLYDIEGGHDRDLAREIDEELQLDLSFAKSTFLVQYQRMVPFIWAAVLCIYFVNLDIANSLVSILFVINLLLTLRRASETSNVQNHLSKASIMLRSYKDALGNIFDAEWKSDFLHSRISEYKSKSEESNAVGIIQELQQIIEHLDYRLNLIPSVVLNGLVLWDFRVLARLSRWKQENSGKLNELFAFVGEMEAISSMATFAYNNPEYCYPELENTYFELEAIDVKHPLILEEDNVGNDFGIGNGQHLSIITGSNMSGKSTLLRTIGINIILGYTGAPVAARKFKYSIVTLISYMRIKDILEESVSTFKAELNRIQLILNILEEDPRCFILIDEMLRGTNSKDKLTGSIGIAKRLLREKTYTMIATHDIKLAELGNDIKSGISNYYFDIDYAEGDLVFDYKVKEGICENFNASFLLKQLGIEMEEDRK